MSRPADSSAVAAAAAPKPTVPGGADYDLSALTPQQLAEIMISAAGQDEDGEGEPAPASMTNDTASSSNVDGRTATQRAQEDAAIAAAAQAQSDANAAAAAANQAAEAANAYTENSAPDPTAGADPQGAASAEQDAEGEQQQQLGDNGAEHDAIAAMGRLAGMGPPSSSAAGDYSKRDVGDETLNELGDESMMSQMSEGGGSSPRKGKNGNPKDERARKDLHKEVERRRREQISLGIAELSQIVPNCDPKSTNKSAIVSNAVRYIQDLKSNENDNLEKWTLEKLLMDQAMSDLQKQYESKCDELERLRAHFGIGPSEGEAAEGQAQQQQQQQQQTEGGEFYNDGAAEADAAAHAHQEAAAAAAQEGGAAAATNGAGPSEGGQIDQQLEMQQDQLDAGVASLRDMAEAAADAAAGEAAAEGALTNAEGRTRTHEQMQGDDSYDARTKRSRAA